MTEGDDSLLIIIPSEDEVPLGRTIRGKWKIKIKEKPIVLSWNSLTQPQWNSMTGGLWNEMTQ
ncbi:hypothetical protein LCGC14_0758770 [marine sediment metagenome]|uniref:Uncharacterized protein n=1 Tax=marine sediment metagenome TaxID=412755 RepID=A0A0F9QLN7_9ZZZZ